MNNIGEIEEAGCDCQNIDSAGQREGRELDGQCMLAQSSRLEERHVSADLSDSAAKVRRARSCDCHSETSR